MYLEALGDCVLLRISLVTLGVCGHLDRLEQRGSLSKGWLMGQGVVPDLLVSVDKLDLGWIRRWLSDYNDNKVAAP